MYHILEGSAKPGGTIPSTVHYQAFGGFSPFYYASEVQAQTVCPVPLDLSSFLFNFDVAPGVGITYTITVRKNGVDTALTCTISGASTTSGTDVTHAVRFAAGDLISISVTPSAAPANPAILNWKALANSIGSSQALMFRRGGTNSTSVVNYMGPVGAGGGATESFNQMLISAPGTIANMYVYSNVAPGAAKSYVYAVRKNGVDQAITATMTGAATNTTNDLAHSFAVAAGDLVSISSTPSGTPASQTPTVGLTFTPTNPGDCIYGTSTGGLSNASTVYVPFHSNWNNASTIEADQRTLPGPMTLKNIYANLVSAPGAGTSFAFAFRQNTVTTALTTTIANTNTASNAKAAVTVQQGDVLDFSIAPSGTPVTSAFQLGYCIAFPNNFLPVLMR